MRLRPVRLSSVPQPESCPRRRSIACSIATGAACVTSAVTVFAARAQELIRSIPSTGFPAPTLTMSVDGCGDVDYDSVDDVIVGVTSTLGEGVVKVVSGRTGVVVHKLFDPAIGLFGSKVVGLGEIDGDGRMDFGIVGQGTTALSSVVRVVSGGSGADFLTYVTAPGGSDLAAVGDINGDLFADVFVYSTASTMVGQRAIRYGLSLNTGRVINEAGEVAGLGDLNGDGRGEYAVALAGPPGRVLVFSGATGTLLRLIGDPGPGSGLFAQSVAAAGDIDDDGYSDMLVGEPLYDGIAVDCGRVLVFSGHDGSLLRAHEGVLPNGMLGDRGRLDGCGDADGDGRADYVLGRPEENGGVGVAEVYSGRTGLVLYSVGGDAPGDHFGLAVAGAGDTTYDRLGEIIVASLDGDRAAVYGYTRAGVQYCFGDGNGTPCPCANLTLPGQNAGCMNSRNYGGTLVSVGNASVSADTLRLFAAHMPGGSTCLFLQATQDGGGTGVLWGDGLLCLGGDFVRLGTRTVDNQSHAVMGFETGTLPLSIRGQIPPAGGTYHYQARYRNSAPFCSRATFNTTAGLRIDWFP